MAENGWKLFMASTDFYFVTGSIGSLQQMSSSLRLADIDGGCTGLYIYDVAFQLIWIALI